MPNIFIRQLDNTTAGASSYSNFSVVVAGESFATYTEDFPSPFDDNGVWQCSDPEKFVQYTLGEGETANDFATLKNTVAVDLGWQCAYELLCNGYTVLYKRVLSDDDLAALTDEDEKKLYTPTETAFWEPLTDRTTYDFRYILNEELSGGTEATQRATAIRKVVATRKDCFAICDVPSTLYDGKSTSAAVKAIQASELFQVTTMTNEAGPLGQGNGGADHLPTDDEIRDETGALKYVAYFAPWVQYADTALASAAITDNRRFPGGFHYLVCAKKAFNAFSEWYAVAGYTRGVSPMTVTGLGAKFGDAAVEALQPRVWTELQSPSQVKPHFQNAINVISNVKGVPYVWGNRTAYALDDKGLVASHFLNIRQLCCTLKKAIYVACRKLTFDPNSDALWLNFKGLVEPTLDKMQADQGINSYELLRYRPKDAKKAALYVKVRITPIEAVEDFDITIMLEDSNTEITE